MTQAVEPKGAALHIFPFARDLEGSFDASVENGAKDVTAFHDRLASSRSAGNPGMKGLLLGSKESVSQIPGLTVVSAAESDARDDARASRSKCWDK